MDLTGRLAKSLLEAAPDPTVIVSSSGTIEFVNARIEQIFGYAAAELIGQPVEILLPARFRDPHRGHRSRYFQAPKQRPMGVDLALFGLHKDGREFPVEISLSPVVTETGTLVVGAIRDASAHKRAESQLIEANRAKTRFLAAASHDLRQPLQTLNLLNRAARVEAADNQALASILERQQRALDSMSELLASVLDISKLDGDRLVPRPANTPVDGIFERLRADLEAQALDKGLTLHFESSPHTTFTDPELLRRLLGNLISNAIRYTNAGRIDVRCTEDGNALRLSVTDTGIGIAADQLERIFEEFYQIDHGSQRPEGLGLGLSIVKRLAERLGYRLKLTSTPGEGTTVGVTVPRGKSAVRHEPRRRSAARHTSRRILIVDDEPAVAQATMLLLELEGYRVELASCEEEAVEQALENPPDLIISDYQLRGGETGLGVITAVRGRLNRDVPVVFMTGDTSRPALEQCKIGDAAVLTKPIPGDDLLEAIHHTLGSAASESLLA